MSFGRITPLTTMADGTLKQVNPFSDTQVWTVPGRGNRPLDSNRPAAHPLDPATLHSACAFCSERVADTPPEKARIIPMNKGWEIQRHLLPHEQEATKNSWAFRRVPNLFEIMPFSYWHDNYGFEPDAEISSVQQRYLDDPHAREHIYRIVDTRLRASGRKPADISPKEHAMLVRSYFAGGHDIIIAQCHFVDDATHDDQLASSGDLSPQEHYAFIALTIDAIRDLYARIRYAPYIAVFQNWLKPAGASFEHLHKQVVAIDERGVQAELEIERLRRNPNLYNEWAINFASYNNLVIAENEHAILIAGVGHRYPTLGLYSKSAEPFPWRQSPAEIRGMSDLLHAAHASTGTHVPTNEEWHYQPIDLDVAMPWRINIKWRVSNLAGFEGVTKIYINTLSPIDVRDRTVEALYRLRKEGKISGDIRIATECSATRNALRYNPHIQ